jgi:hypothetical protein
MNEWWPPAVAILPAVLKGEEMRGRTVDLIGHRQTTRRKLGQRVTYAIGVDRKNGKEKATVGSNVAA